MSSKDLDRATVKKIDAGADFVYWVILLVDWGDYFFVLPSTLNILQPKVGLMLSLISCSRLAPLINSVEMKAQQSDNAAAVVVVVAGYTDSKR